VARGDNESEVMKLLEETVAKIKDRIGESIYSYNDEGIEEVVFKILKEKNYKIAFAESCTGGLVSSRFTQISGVSEVFDRGIVTYSNMSKMEELNVSRLTLDRYSAVSEETALEMAKGLMDKTNVDIALSITGYAGPPSGEDEPVGLVYIGIASRDKSKVIKTRLNGDRISIQNKAALKAFNELRKFLLNM